MSVELVTKEDLQLFRIQLISDLKMLFEKEAKQEDKTEWLRSKQVRQMLNVSPGTLQNLRIAGKLHPKKIGGSWYYSKTEIQELFSNTVK